MYKVGTFSHESKWKVNRNSNCKRSTIVQKLMQYMEITEQSANKEGTLKDDI